MNKSQLTTQIGYRIRTASRNFISDAEILAELNRSLDRLSSKVDLKTAVKEATISFTGDGTYSWTSLSISDFKKPISLYDSTNKHLYKLVTLSELRQGASDGQHLYAVDGTNVYIESTVSSATLTFTYYSTYDAKTSGGTLQKGLSSNTDEPLLQSRFHDYFVEDVSAVLYRKEQKYDDYKIARGEANSIYQEIIDENPTYEEDVEVIINPYPESYE